MAIIALEWFADSFDLRRFTDGNDDFTASTTVPFDEDGPCTIPGRSTFVIARNDGSFLGVFGVDPSIEGGSSSSADSNGGAHHTC